MASILQFILLLTTAVILAHVGTVYTVWFVFVITEVLVAGAAVFLMCVVTKRQLPVFLIKRKKYS